MELWTCEGACPGFVSASKTVSLPAQIELPVEGQSEPSRKSAEGKPRAAATFGKPACDSSFRQHM